MQTVLVTGGTGTLGKPLVQRLAAAGADVRVLTRKPRNSVHSRQIAGDLGTGEGLADAVSDVDTIVHCAHHRTQFGAVEELGAQRLLELAQERGIGHFVYISIVGIDELPVPYYRMKLRTEQRIADSGVPYTILRATQFHDLVLTIVAGLAKLPVALVPRGFSTQSIDVRAVADRLADLTAGKPAGRARDIGGPRADAIADLVQVYCAATGKSRSLLPFGVPGKVGRAFRSGMNLLPADGERLGGTFDDFLAERFAK